MKNVSLRELIVLCLLLPWTVAYAEDVKKISCTPSDDGGYMCVQEEANHLSGFTVKTNLRVDGKSFRFVVFEICFIDKEHQAMKGLSTLIKTEEPKDAIICLSNGKRMYNIGIIGEGNITIANILLGTMTYEIGFLLSVEELGTLRRHDIETIQVGNCVLALRDMNTSEVLNRMCKMMIEKTGDQGQYGATPVKEKDTDVQNFHNSGMNSSQTTSQPQSYTQPSSHTNTTTESQSNTPVYSSTTSTSHNNNTYHYRKRYNHSFNEKKDDYFMGLSIGYVQKQWTFDFKDGSSEKGGFWDDSKQISGVQAGIRVNPQFGYGFGLNTGLYYEYYYSKSDRMNYTDDYGQYTGTLQEHALYLPVHLEYRMNFSKYFQLFFYGGIGLDYGLANSIKWVDCDDDSYSETINNIYDSDDCPDWQRFNYSLEYGGGIRTSHLQLNFTMSQGLRNMSSTDEYKVYQGKNLMLSLSVML